MAKTLRAKCLVAIQLLARLEAANDEGYCECVSCGAKHHYKEMDGGHFIPKGSSSYWALEKENVHPQCKGCNGFGMKSGIAAQQYTIWMQNYYGADFVDEMLASKRNIKKLYTKDYKEMLSEMNKEIRFHKERLGEI